MSHCSFQLNITFIETNYLQHLQISLRKMFKLSCIIKIIFFKNGICVSLTWTGSLFLRYMAIAKGEKKAVRLMVLC